METGEGEERKEKDENKKSADCKQKRKKPRKIKGAKVARRENYNGFLKRKERKEREV